MMIASVIDQIRERQYTLQTGMSTFILYHG